MSEFLAGLSVWAVVAAGAALIALVNLGFAVAAELRFRKAAKAAAAAAFSGEEEEAAPGGGGSTGAPRFGPLALALREGYVLKRAERGFRGLPGPVPGLPEALGYAELWAARALKRGSPKAMARLLRYAPGRGLFDCFVASLRAPKLGEALLAWLDERADAFPLREIALSAPGRAFDGRAAATLLAGRMDAVRELLGDQEWAARALALRVLAHDAEPRSVAAVKDSLADPHPLVRSLAAQAPFAGDRLEFYTSLYGLFADDPAYEVRKAAKARIMADFPDLYAPDPARLSAVGLVHVLELLDPASAADEELAFKYLAEGDDEQKLAAAELLDRRGSLRELVASAPAGDRVEFERRLGLALAAARLQVGGFLAAAEAACADGPIELAARVLAEAGDRRLIAGLAALAFSRMGAAPYPAERLRSYRAALEAVRARGDEAACAALAGELAARRKEPELMAALLGATDGGQARCIFASLSGLFMDPDFQLRGELRAALMRQPRDLVVPFALSFLRAERASTPRALRIDALVMAGKLGLKAALQRSLEALPTLDPEDIASLAPIIAGEDPDAFKAKARYILSGVDAPSRAALIAAIPAAGEKGFAADIKAALKDADPDVRVAAARTLAAMHEAKALSSGAMDLLRDPVKRVRVASAAALAELGGAAVIAGLKQALADPNEEDEVKDSVILGLAKASDGPSLELLCDELAALDADDEGRARFIVAALASRRAKKDLERIIERFKDATGSLKGRISKAMRAMGPEGEQALVDILREDVASLRPYAVEALESTGYVEARVRELKHRDPAKRMAAAQALDLVGSVAAFRGIVLAARDPHPEVRVAVTKALERLAGPEGKELLAELERDPDAKVRRYALWAAERVKAKSM